MTIMDEPGLRPSGLLCDSLRGASAKLTARLTSISQRTRVEIGGFHRRRVERHVAEDCVRTQVDLFGQVDDLTNPCYHSLD